MDGSQAQAAEEAKAAQPCLSSLLGKQGAFRGRLLCGWNPLVPSTGQTQSSTSRRVQTAGFLMETWSYGNALWVSMATISACVKTPLRSWASPWHVPAFSSQWLLPPTNVCHFRQGHLSLLLFHAKSRERSFPNHSPSLSPPRLCFTASVKIENVLPLRSCLFLKKNLVSSSPWN